MTKNRRPDVGARITRCRPEPTISSSVDAHVVDDERLREGARGVRIAGETPAYGDVQDDAEGVIVHPSEGCRREPSTEASDNDGREYK